MEVKRTKAKPEPVKLREVTAGSIVSFVEGFEGTPFLVSACTGKVVDLETGAEWSGYGDAQVFILSGYLVIED